MITDGLKWTCRPLPFVNMQSPQSVCTEYMTSFPLATLMDLTARYGDTPNSSKRVA